MRGRRIKEFLKQVQSQKIDALTGENDGTPTKPEQEYQDLIAMDETTLMNDMKPFSAVHSAGVAYEEPPNLNSQSSVLRQNEDYSGAVSTDTRQILSNKLKSPWGEANPDTVSNSQNSINQMESQKNGAWLSS